MAARTAITVQVPKGPYPGTVSAGDLDFTMTAADVSNGNSATWRGNRMLVIAQNTDGANPYTITLTSVVDSQGRTGTITSYSLAAADVVGFMAERDGWQQTDNTIYLDANNAAIKFAVLAIP